MTVITFTSASPPHPHLRRFDLRRDLNAVADLLEQCFTDTLDADGRRYIRQMRSAARHPHLLRWTAGVVERTSAPFSGFVWEQGGQVVGNLSQIPMSVRGKKVHLIANVTVHPNYRRRGIARALTAAALEFSEQHNAKAIWLHVRDDNPAATMLYRDLGFVERTRRTDWVIRIQERRSSGAEGVRVGPRRREHWPQQLHWLNQLNPQELDWYLPLNVNALRPGLLGFFHRLFSDVSVRQWSATRQGQLLGVLAWNYSPGSADRLWLAVPPKHEAEAIKALIPFTRRHLSKHRPLKLEYPAGRGAEALELVGFSPRRTLIWMEYR